MSEYRPYKKLRNNSSTRLIRDKKVTWPDYKKYFNNDKICFRLIEHKDIQIVSNLWRECYGELYGSPMNESWVLYPDLYNDYVVFRDNFNEVSMNKDYFMLIFENVLDSTIWGAWVFWKDDNNLQVDFGFGFIHPDFRHSNRDFNFEFYLQDFLDIIEKESGAEYFTVACETFQSKTQFLCFKRWGFKIAGIFPGEVTRWNGEQNEYRACIIHFYKFKPEIQKYISTTDEWNLLPEIQSIWNNLKEINLNNSHSTKDFIFNE